MNTIHSGYTHIMLQVVHRRGLLSFPPLCYPHPRFPSQRWSISTESEMIPSCRVTVIRNNRHHKYMHVHTYVCIQMHTHIRTHKHMHTLNLARVRTHTVSHRLVVTRCLDQSLNGTQQSDCCEGFVAVIFPRSGSVAHIHEDRSLKAGWRKRDKESL